MKYFISILLLSLTIACSQSKEEPAKSDNQFDSKIAQAAEFTKNREFSTALATLSMAGQLEGRDSEKMHESFQNVINTIKASDDKKTLADAHLAYGIWMEYYGIDMSNPSSMREMMTGALSHYRRVLELDPSNDKALSEIAQIEGIYKQMGREVPQGVAE